ncbi:MAG: GumC family protein [Candidatus Aminicenantia bacterium]
MEEREKMEKEINLLAYWEIIKKRKWVIFTTVVTLVFATGLFSFLATPIYQAKVTFLIEKENPEVWTLQELFGLTGGWWYYQEYYNTQIKLLYSRSLAQRVIKKMNLDRGKEFGAGKSNKRGVLTTLKSWILPSKKERKINGSKNYTGLITSFLSRLEVLPVRQTRMVEVKYKSANPQLAADILNTFADEFTNFHLEKKYEATKQASDFLAQQIANLRNDLAEKERELQKYSQEKKMFFLSDKESTIVSKFAALNTAFTEAQIERIKREATYRELKELKVDALPPFVDNTLIQNLKEEYTQIKNKYEEKSKIFKPEYPEMIRLKARLESMRDELKKEIEKAIQAAESDYRAAFKKEKSLENLLESQKQEVIRLNNNAILYNSLKIEIENKRNLFNSLTARQNETLISARLKGLKTSNIKIIDRAEAPLVPISPKKKRNLILAFIIGFFGGFGLAFFLEYIDKSVKTPEEVESLTRLPTLGVIPYLPPEGFRGGRYGYRYRYHSKKTNPSSTIEAPNKIELITFHHPKFTISEDYRSFRTSILLSRADSPPKTIAVTSALPKEGKTVTVVNLGISFTQLEKRVLLIDADLRKPRIHKILKVRNIEGLSSYLTGKMEFDLLIKPTGIENLSVITSGIVPPNPAELVNSNRMKQLIKEVREMYDLVLIDTPPVLVVVDPVIVSSMTDSTILVLWAGKTSREALLKAVEELAKSNCHIGGVVLNEVQIGKTGYYYQDYYRYHYYAEETPKQS